MERLRRTSRRPWSYDGPAHPVRARDPVASQNPVASQARPGEGPSRTTWGPRPVASLWHEDLWRHLAPVRCRKAASRSLSSIGVNATELQVYPARHGTLSHDAASSAHLQRQTSGGATRASRRSLRRSLRRNWRRNWRRNSVHKCPKTGPRGYFRQSVYTPASPTSAHNGATVYTNALKRTREAIFADLCTLLRPPPTSARATGRGHGSHDVNGPMAPAMPGRSGLRTTPPER